MELPDIVLAPGARVWVWDPFLFGSKIKAGKITGCNVNPSPTVKLLGYSKTEYLVDFGDDGRHWVGTFQITGWLELARQHCQTSQP